MSEEAGRAMRAQLKRYRFKARIEKGDGGGAYVLFPFDVETEFGVIAKGSTKRRRKRRAPVACRTPSSK